MSGGFTGKFAAVQWRQALNVGGGGHLERSQDPTRIFPGPMTDLSTEDLPRKRSSTFRLGWMRQ